MSTLVLLLVLLGDARRPKTTVVDMIEVNHCHDACGVFRFTQIVLWDWSPDYCRYHVVAWWIPERLIDEIDGHTARRSGKTIEGRLMRETWTSYDPEVLNRKVFACELRRGF